MFWVAWGSALALPAVSLVGHGWRLTTLTTTMMTTTHMTPKMELMRRFTIIPPLVLNSNINITSNYKLVYELAFY